MLNLRVFGKARAVFHEEIHNFLMVFIGHETNQGRGLKIVVVL